MLVTREMDYAMRVIRGLDGREHLETAAGIAERENLPQGLWRAAGEPPGDTG